VRAVRPKSVGCIATHPQVPSLRNPYGIGLQVHLDQAQPGHDPAPLADWLAAEGIPLHLIREDT
jgi:hypothetical protein